MERFIFDRPEYDRLYNCSMKTPDEWFSYGKKNIPLGVFFICLGIVFELFYIPVLIAMLDREFFKYPSYKMMFVVGIIDILTLIEICFMDGYDVIFGEVFCTSPTRIYIFGVLSTSLDRCLEILAPRYAQILFSGYRTWIWIMGCFIYGLYAFFFQYPFLFNSKYVAVFFNPHFGDEFMVKIDNPAYIAHNFFVAASIGSLYLIICFGWCIKYKKLVHTTVTKSQRMINIQSFMISTEILGAGLIYIYFQNFPVPDFCYVIGHILWQLAHGDSGIVYFFINRSIRAAVIRKIKKILRRTGMKVSVIPIKTSSRLAIKYEQNPQPQQNRLFESRQ